MNPTIPGDMPATSRTGLRPAALALVVAAGILTAATAALWAHYGTQVFYEMIVAGLDACF
jgi:hypothetical protein